MKCFLVVYFLVSCVLLVGPPLPFSKCNINFSPVPKEEEEEEKQNLVHQ
jgi:hypothetical protein